MRPAGSSTGVIRGLRIRRGVSPQVAPNWAACAVLRFEINLRASAILGFVGQGGIGYGLKLAMQSGRYDQVAGIFLTLFLTTCAKPCSISAPCPPRRFRKSTGPKPACSYIS